MESRINNKKMVSSSNKNEATYIREIDKLNHTIVTLNQKLNNSEKFKTHFISNITNELINPFTSILGLSKTILSVKKEEWKKVISMVALIHSEAFIIDFQLRNIFTAAKIEAGIATIQPVKLDINEFIKSIEETFNLEARKKHVKVTYQTNISDNENCYFITDPEMLKIILSNIVHNAIKFSHNESEVEVNCKLKKKKLIIEVKDQGIGIPKEKFNIIYDRFERLNNTINSINNGQGLGLSVSISFLDILNGKISLKSKENEGSEFIIEIPELNNTAEDIAITDSEIYFNDGEIF